MRWQPMRPAHYKVVHIHSGPPENWESGCVYLQCGGNQLPGPNQYQFSHAVFLREHSGSCHVHKNVGRQLIVDLIRCAVNRKTSDQALPQVELIGKTLDFDFLRWEIFCDA